MSFKSDLKLDAKIFNASERKRTFGSVPKASAKEFRASLKRKMERGPHTGKIVSTGKRGGRDFTRKHRRSRRGERPAPDTRELINSITDERTGDLSAKVEVKAAHGAILQKKLGRQVMTEKDVEEAEKIFDRRKQNALKSLL